jgi:hypothetical protein
MLLSVHRSFFNDHVQRWNQEISSTSCFGDEQTIGTVIVTNLHKARQNRIQASTGAIVRVQSEVGMILRKAAVDQFEKQK